MRTLVMIALVLVGAGTLSAQQPTRYRFVSQEQAAAAAQAQPQAQAPAAGQQSYFNGGCDGRGCDAGCGAGCDGGCDNGCDGRGGRFGGLNCGSGCCSPCCGVYHTFFGGLVVPHNLNFEVPGAAVIFAPRTDVDLDLENGWVVGHGWGRQLDCCLRAEIETSYRNHSLADFEPVAGGPAGPDLPGNLNIFAGMANIIRDLNPRGRCCDIKPYVGVGAGFAFFDLDGGDPGTGFVDSRDSAFAYQAFFGVAKNIRSCIDVYGEYRVFGTDEFCGLYTNPNNLQTQIESSYFSHNFLFGVRIWTK